MLTDRSSGAQFRNPGIDSEMIPFFAGMGIKNIKIKWNLENWLELEFESDSRVNLESESESWKYSIPRHVITHFSKWLG